MMTTKVKLMGWACIAGAVIAWMVLDFLIGTTFEYFGLDVGSNVIEGIVSAIFTIPIFWYAVIEMNRNNGR